MFKKSVNGRGLKLYHNYNRKYFPLKSLQLIFEKISPYFNLWMSAEIVTALYEKRSYQEILLLVCITLFGNLLVTVMESILGRQVETALKVLENNEAAAFHQKTFSLDYDKLENPEIRMLRRKIRENANVKGYGTEALRLGVEHTMGNVLDLLFAAVLFAEMMTAIVKVGIRPVVIILLFLMIAFWVISIVYYRTTGQKEADIYKQVNEFILRENQMARGHKLNGMDARIYRQQSIVTKRENDMNVKHLACFLWANRKTLPLASGYVYLSRVPEICAYLLVCFYCVVGAFPVGNIIKYVGYFKRVTHTSLQLFRSISDLKNNEPFLQTYLEYFDLKNDMYQGSLTVEKRSDKRFEIEFQNVSFKYVGAEQYALKNINLKLNVGERLAVVGMNGSGKTTFVKLLCRLYDPTEGQICMNDFNIRKYDYRQYLDIFSIVFQDYHLLALPLGNNVSSSASWDVVKAERLLAEVGFSERYAAMPGKLETPLYKNFDEDGVNVSGGEAQKIALARALYKDAAFIILDEPTAALDPLAEAEIYSKFDTIVGDKTAIYISHRLSSCRFCDKIAVFDKGEIVQMGTHEELVADESGKYYELWHAQAQYYAV